jgi:hypothetical protein
MRFLRALLGGLLWIVASLLGLVAVLLCVTVILLPLGIPLLKLARGMFGKAIGLMLPKALTHPVDEAGKKTRKARRDAAPAKVAGSAKARSKKLSKKARKKAGKLTGRRRRWPLPGR